jgi:ribosomal protein S18 acetylase RimI-like enzyme
VVIIRNWRSSDDGLLVDALVERGWVTADRYRNKFSDDGVVPDSIFVAESEGAVCGHLLIAFRTLLYAGAEVPAANIGLVLVDESYRGRGVGSLLLDTALGYIREMKVPLTWLNTIPGDGPAYAMYRRRGFESIQGRLFADLELTLGGTSIGVISTSDCNDLAIVDLRSRVAKRTALMQSRNYDMADGCAWYLIGTEEVIAAAAIRYWQGKPNLVSLLYEYGTDPLPCIEATAAEIGADSIRIHSAPKSPLATDCPELPWFGRAGEHVILITDLETLISSIRPGIDGGDNSPVEQGMCLEINYRGETTQICGQQDLNPNESGPSRAKIVFSDASFPALLAGSECAEKLRREGLIDFRSDTVDFESVTRWLFPHSVSDPTQLQEW